MSRAADERTAVTVVAGVSRRLILFVVPVWLLPVLGPALDSASGWPRAAVLAALVLALGGWFAFRLRSTPAVVLVPLAASTLLLAAVQPVRAGAFAEDLILEQWVNLLAWSIGVLIVSVRNGLLLVGAAVAAVLAVLLLRAELLGLRVNPDTKAALAAYALTDGLAAVAALGALRRTAVRTDRLTEERAQAALELEAQRARTLENRRFARVMHDTVVNTLGAIRRWELTDREAVATRAQEDLELLGAMHRVTTRDLVGLQRSLQQRAQLLGIDLRTRVAVPSLRPPLDVLEALEGAGWELLNNVAKHAGVQTANLELRQEQDALVAVFADGGMGFDPGATQLRGLAESVQRRCREVGFAVDIDSAPGEGTRVRLRWQAAGVPSADRADPQRTLDQNLGFAGGWLSLALTAMGVTATLRLGLGPESSWFGAIPLVVSGGLIAAAFAAHWGRPVLRLYTPLYAVLAALAVAAPSWGIAGCMRVTTWWWGPFAGLVVGTYVALLDTRRRALVATVLGTWVGYGLAIGTLTGDVERCGRDTVAFAVLHTGILLAVAASRRSHLRIWERGQEALAAAERDRLLAVSEATTTALRERLTGFATGIAAPLLRGLADGTLEPSAPEVRKRAGAAESALRALGGLPAGYADEAVEAFTGAVIAAHARGVSLHVHIATDRQPAAPKRARLRQQLLTLVAACPDGSAAQVTVLANGDALDVIGLVHAVLEPAALSVLHAVGWNARQLGDDVVAECVCEAGE